MDAAKRSSSFENNTFHISAGFATRYGFGHRSLIIIVPDVEVEQKILELGLKPVTELALGNDFCDRSLVS